MALTATQSARQATLNTRLANVQTAIAATLERNAASYTTEIQSLTSLGLDELYRMEKAIVNELARLERLAAGNRMFGGVRFVRST